jgi:hypothetical protein
MAWIDLGPATAPWTSCACDECIGTWVTGSGSAPGGSACGLATSPSSPLGRRGDVAATEPWFRSTQATIGGYAEEIPVIDENVISPRSVSFRRGSAPFPEATCI